MPRDDQPDSTLPRRQLGRALRDAREGAGFTLEQAAREMEMGKTSVIRIEKGHNDKVKQRDVDGFGRLYGLSDQRIDELKTLAQQMATKSWWQADRHLIRPGYGTYLGLESGASQLFSYQPLIVPGLLQIADYARAIEQPYRPTDTSEDLERRVSVRLKRSAILTRQRNPIPAEFIIHESVLHTLVGSRTVMANECRHMADMSTRNNVTLRILPSTAGFPAAGVPVQPYTILDFPASGRGFDTEPPVVYCENTTGSMCFEDDADVRQFRDIHEVLKRATLDEQASRDLLRQVARRYDP
ncbi:helix-turn-helix domain-containing protein [Nocardia anaemiae]|uniref:helix-turn-helix domain-containing protein n=1 Tax=Nocardia anaemiae TaxID=263910 RepID=UPI0007A5484A|nr:helix-turn-helix transcriptional regulator [Nocardia anaemiae]